MVSRERLLRLARPPELRPSECAFSLGLPSPLPCSLRVRSLWHGSHVELGTSTGGLAWLVPLATLGTAAGIWLVILDGLG
jgi:hypothetical protein